MNHLRFYPCKHTKRDGLYLSPESVENTGRHTILIPDMNTHKAINREITIKRCPQCSKES